MSADEKRKLLALRAEMGRLAAEIAIARAGAVLAAEIRRLDAEIAAERAKCGPDCRHGRTR